MRDSGWSLMVPETNFADIELARQIVQQRYPDARRIEFIEHGYDNVVALVDTNYAIRFPRHHEAYIRSQYEQAILPKLTAITAVEVPKLLESHQNPPYLVTAYVMGRHLTADAINALSSDEQAAFGATVGAFAHQLHASVAVQAQQELRENLGLEQQFDQSWADYFKHDVAEGVFALPEQATIAKTMYTSWQELASSATESVVVHDDLHLDNMLFSGTQLVGIVDFGEANVGSPEQEFRQLYRLNKTVLKAAVATYQDLSGRQLTSEAIKVWAIMQELGAYSRRLSAHQTDHPSFIRSCANLDIWFPEGRWSEAATRS